MDPIANMFSSIKNSLASNRDDLVVNYSKIKKNILDNFKLNQYIYDYKIIEEKNTRKKIKIILKNSNLKNTISHLKRISKPGLRVYVGYSDIPRVLGGFGDVVLSTPKGILNGKTAKKLKIGGEIICEVY
jgi:small subunit ribosomal protein S8